MSQFKRPPGRPIGQIHACQMASPPRIGPAAQVEFGGVICKCEFMPHKEALKAGPRDLPLQISLDALELSLEHLRKPPVYFWVAARDDRREQRFHSHEVAVIEIDLRQMDALAQTTFSPGSDF
jgi:hypothetical protein